MRLKHGIHLGYCTNIHRGETWGETFAALREHTDAVRRRVASEEPYGVGLRLGAAAAAELDAETSQRDEFRRWLEGHDSYLYSINGFPYGAFHGTRVKEQVYAPDWSAPERLDYTLRLFDLLNDLAPADEEISVSTLPGSFKAFLEGDDGPGRLAAIQRQLRLCAERLESLAERSGRDVHLGLEPEPLGLFENSVETVAFFESLQEGCSAEERDRLRRRLGVNYDTCHLAVEYESAPEAVAALDAAGLRLSKIHLSSALKLEPSEAAVAQLASFAEDVYLHQVLVRSGAEVVERFADLPEALAWHAAVRDTPREDGSPGAGDEWRVHFHVPIHREPAPPFADTRDHLVDLLGIVAAEPGRCRHFEMETYTWEVLPPELRSGDVVDQLVEEYRWCLAAFEQAGLR